MEHDPAQQQDGFHNSLLLPEILVVRPSKQSGKATAQTVPIPAILGLRYAMAMPIPLSANLKSNPFKGKRLTGNVGLRREIRDSGTVKVSV